jgi:CarboxypepD_reg-like domain
MRKVFLLFLFIGFNIHAYNQVIRGTVLENVDKSPIYSAAIYFSGSFAGTLSDKDGNFELDISKNISMPLTISSIGHYSVTLKDFSTDKPLIIYLNPKVFELTEVVISSKPLVKKRKKYLKLFKNQFLGNTYNAWNCDIINENDITFNYDSCDDTLKAYSSNPLIINNRALGYKMTYYLDKFEYYDESKSFLFKGSVIFNQDLLSGKSDKQLSKRLFETRRQNTYLGSRMHFFRALWAKKLTSARFSILNSEGRTLRYKDIVRQEQIHGQDSIIKNRKYLRHQGDLQVNYLELSTIMFNKARVYFDKDGNYDIDGITWDGDMAKFRVGDMLPSEYKEPGK